MKKNIIMPLVLLAATALMTFSCNRKDEPQEAKRQIYPVRMTLNPPTSMRWEVTKPDASQPRQLKFNWKAHATNMKLVIFQQEDNAQWKSDATKYLITTSWQFSSEAIHGNKLDLSQVFGTVDFTGKNFEKGKKLKYVVVAGNDLLGNGIYSPYWNSPLSSQLNNIPAWTPVLETKHPEDNGGVLELSGTLQWASAALAVKYEVDPAFSGTTFSGDSFYLEFYGNSNGYIDGLDPVLKKERYSDHSFIVGIREVSGKKISEMVDAEGYRYYTIPAYLPGSAIKMQGSKIKVYNSWDISYGSKDIKGMEIGQLDDKPIEPGKCYSITIKVKDDGTGKPKFVKE